MTVTVMLSFTTLCLLVLVSTIGAAPSAYHDQRQNGELNVRTHLDNFIVVLIPTSNLGGSLSWLDFTKRLNLQNHLKYVRDDKPKDQEKSSSVREEEDDERRVAAPVILEKTPYTVDVEIKSKSSPLSRLHPQPVLDISSDVMIALSPSVSLSKTPESVQEASKPPVKTPPAPEMATESHEHAVNVPRAPEKAETVHHHAAPPSVSEKAPKAPERATEAAFHPPEVKPLEEPARMVKKSKSILSTTLDRVQKASKVADAEKTIEDEKDLRVRLLGAGIEVCASHERRGDDGNCEPIKARRRSGQYFAPSGLLPSLRFGLAPANE